MTLQLHHRPAHADRSDRAATNWCFWIFPEAVVGRDSQTSSLSGSLYVASPTARRRVTAESR
ncbi:MAG TPA: hypothetical protein VFH70_02185, partial [Acidimicrobiales bacterium]|nr:hypothetical protein [Acidimicrobiales bacterium]